jgi:restriction system protein
MTIPDFQTLMRPVLAQLSDGEIHPTKWLIDTLAEQVNLTDEERTRLITSGSKKWNGRVNWAITYLAQAGLVERPRRAHARITEEGREALVANLERVDMKTLEAYPAYREFRERTRSAKQPPIESSAASAVADESATSPQERIDAAVAENKAAVEGEPLKLALGLEPQGFELLVIRLLTSVGYGQRGRIEHSGQPGDHGIDGIISQDPLGLDRIYLQAKRYTDISVQRPEIQKFVGALMGAQGDRGSSLQRALSRRARAKR